MKLEIFIKSLSESEKNLLFNLLANEIVPTVKIEKYRTIEEFVAEKHSLMSTRMRNVLKDNAHNFTYIEVLDPNDLVRCRNSSFKIAEEFIKLRGF